jgi:hypothetical protein
MPLDERTDNQAFRQALINLVGMNIPMSHEKGSVSRGR